MIKNYKSFLNEGYTDLLRVARSHPYSNDTETDAYPTNRKVPQQFLDELNMKLHKPGDYALVLEIQFDTKKLILQGYTIDKNGESENYDDCFSYDVKNLSNDFQKWLIENISQEIKNIRTRTTSRKYGI